MANLLPTIEIKSITKKGADKRRLNYALMISASINESNEN